MFKRLVVLGTIVGVVLMLLAGMAVATSQENSGNGMNRQGQRSQKLHGRDPGQDQGSPHNTADPDCTGNRTENPQPTNNGECDAPTTGAADKPGGSGGFDEDKDWNNGCGNDMDREDDNNGHCGKPKLAPTNPPPPPPPGGTEGPGGSDVGGQQGGTQVLGESFTRDPVTVKVASAGGPKPTAVLGAQFSRLPRTGQSSPQLLLIGLAMIGAGAAFLMKRKALA